MKPVSPFAHARPYPPAQTRGAVIGAISTTELAYSAPIEVQDALGLTDGTSASVWMRRDPDLVGYTAGLVPFPVPPAFNVHEAATAMEVWHHNEGLHTGMLVPTWSKMNMCADELWVGQR